MKPCLGQPTDEHNSDRETRKMKKRVKIVSTGDNIRYYSFTSFVSQLDLSSVRGIDGVTRVLIIDDYTVTVNKAYVFEWSEIEPLILAAMTEMLGWEIDEVEINLQSTPT